MPRTALPEPLARTEFDALEGMAQTLTSSGWYRVVRRFQPRDRYAAADGAPKRTALFVDVETTGLNVGADAIIEFSAVPFEYGVRDGQIYAVGEPVTFFEDPGWAIPEAITELTGITDEMVRGQRIDDTRVSALLSGVALVVAHNAAFDRRWLERRLPAFAAKPWACSRDDVPWHLHGCAGRTLEYILFRTCAEFLEGHRAAEDCYAGIHILAMRTCAGALPMGLLLENARTPTARIWAFDTPRGSAAALRARHYRWSDGADGRAKGWYIDVPEPRAQAEREWLATAIYRGRPPALRVQRYTALERYSGRV
jgi:DNA polymerase-3 subunit epsilon